MEKNKPFTCRAVLLNHSAREEPFEIRPHLPKGWTLKGMSANPVRIPPGQEGVIELAVAPAADAQPGLFVITADVQTPQADLREWIEALVRIRP